MYYGNHMPKADPQCAEKKQWRDLLSRFEGKPESLIPMLQAGQNLLGYLPRPVLLDIAAATGLPPAKVFGVATFYAQFRLQPVGKHIIRVCRGTACHVRGSQRICKELQDRLHVAPGETTSDRRFTLETVACFGSCALAPVMVVDDAVHGRMKPAKAKEVIDGVAPEKKSPPENAVGVEALEVDQ